MGEDVLTNNLESKAEKDQMKGMEKRQFGHTNKENLRFMKNADLKLFYVCESGKVLMVYVIIASLGAQICLPKLFILK